MRILHIQDYNGKGRCREASSLHTAYAVATGVGSAHLPHPVVRIGDLTELDAQQLIANRHRELARFATRIALLRGVLRFDDELAGLDVVEQLVQGDHRLDDVMAIVLKQLDNRTTGDTREDVAG